MRNSPDLKQARPEVLARHWTEAGELQPAIAEWSRAGKAAEGRGAFAETVKSYEQALALLDLLAESPERDARELELRIAAYFPVAMIKGFAAPETINVAERMTALAERSGGAVSLLASLGMRSGGALVAGDYPTADVLGDQALETCSPRWDPNSYRPPVLRSARCLLLARRSHPCRAAFRGRAKVF